MGPNPGLMSFRERRACKNHGKPRRWEQTAVTQPQAKIHTWRFAESHQKLRSGKESFFPGANRNGMALLTTGFQNSEGEISVVINFSGFCYFVTTALGKNAEGERTSYSTDYSRLLASNASKCHLEEPVV